jgi:hypothetical protein
MSYEGHRPPYWQLSRALAVATQLENLTLRLAGDLRWYKEPLHVDPLVTLSSLKHMEIINQISFAVVKGIGSPIRIDAPNLTSLSLTCLYGQELAEILVRAIRATPRLLRLSIDHITLTHLSSEALLEDGAVLLPDLLFLSFGASPSDDAPVVARFVLHNSPKLHTGTTTQALWFDASFEKLTESFSKALELVAYTPGQRWLPANVTKLIWEIKSSHFFFEGLPLILFSRISKPHQSVEIPTVGVGRFPETCVLRARGNSKVSETPCILTHGTNTQLACLSCPV